MKLICYGAAQEVGRSAILLKGNDKLLLDYGLKISPKSKDITSDDFGGVEMPFKINDYVNAVVLSHAHLDHSGAIPALYKSGTCPTFLTKATQELSNILWKDTIKIAKIKEIDSIFDKEDIIETNNYCFNIDYRKEVNITKNSTLKFFDAGHIPGSTISLIKTEGKRIMYTGDFRSSESQLFKGYDKNLENADYLITETTYGTEVHKDREKQEKLFIGDILETLDNGGSVIIPAFAIERSQEVIAILKKYRIDAPIYLDGMAKAATNIFLNYPSYFKDYKLFRKAADSVEFIKSQRNRKKLRKEQCIIVTTAGMLEGGPVLGYIEELDDPKNRIILTGYQVEGTNGRRLLESGKLIIDGREFKPRADVKKYSFSAHAGKDEIIKFIKKVNPQKVVCVHGDKENIFKFKADLDKEGFNSVVPALKEVVDL
ncbi:MAG: MBL fold metallo-hydrolase [archaeon]